MISSAGDAGDPVFQESRVIVIAGKPPPTGWYCAPARDAERHIQPHT
ncbi:hypothetical protein ACTAB8_18670 [Pseudomonas syringae]|nr:hypothetical protein [Pseudomonas viridiflava]QXG46262.1 hypothetical protein KTT57_22100 [Pseudomonas viridiflava]